MTKDELVAKVAEKAGLTKAQAASAVNAFTESVQEAIKSRDKLTLVGFGTFEAVTRAARTGRNPSTGKPIEIAAKTSGKFTPGKNLKDI